MNKRLRMALLTIIMVICTTVKVYAADSCKIELETAKKEYSPGETFIAEVILSDVKVEKGLVVIGGKLLYDKECLELVEIKGKNGWSAPSYNEENGKFVTDRNGYGDKAEVAVQIAFKVKASTAKTASIVLNDIVASNAKTDIPISDVSATFTLQSGGSNETAANAEAGLKQKTVSGTVTQTESMDRDGAVYGGGAEAADTDENGLSQAQPQAEVANSAENSSEKSDVKFNFIIILVIIVMVIAIVELVILLVIFMKKKRR